MRLNIGRPALVYAASLSAASCNPPKMLSAKGSGNSGGSCWQTAATSSGGRSTGH
jgi:hypothetical protein